MGGVLIRLFFWDFWRYWQKALTTEDTKVHKGKQIAAGRGSLLPSHDYRFNDARI